MYMGDCMCVYIYVTICTFLCMKWNILYYLILSGCASRTSPPPRSGGRSSLLIRVADPPPRISCRFPPGDVPQQHGARSSCNCRPPSPPIIPAKCTGMSHPIRGTCRGHPICYRKRHYRSPVPMNRTRSRPRGRNRRPRK